MKKIAIAALLSLSSTMAIADAGFSTELLIGTAEQNLFAPLVETFDISDSESSLGLRGSYTVNEYFGAEVSYQDYGDANRIVEDLSGFIIDDQISLKAINLGVKGSLQIRENLFVNARAGISVWDLKFRREDEAFPNSISRNNANGEDLYYGLGLSYNVLDRVSVGVEYTITDADVLFDATRDTVEAKNEVSNLALIIGLSY